MATLNNGTSNGVRCSQIEAIQSVPPLRVTNPRQTRQVFMDETVVTGVFRRSLNIVLYYNRATKEDSGWVIAGWFKESLMRTLAEQPILCGRLRRGEHGNGELEVVSNDSGARLVEAKIPITLEEFVDLKEAEKLEAELVLWNDIDEEDPQFSPLFYVQVTNFQCGGYSIGVSCSLLLADLLIEHNFILRWAKMHRDVLSKNEALKLPIFYLPNLKPESFSPSGITTASSKNSGQTVIFKSESESLDLKDALRFSVEEAESILGAEMPSEFGFLIKESDMVIKLQTCKKHALEMLPTNLGTRLSASSWDVLGINEIAFHEGNKPCRASCWIGSTNAGLAMAIPVPSSSELNIIVTVPK
ncbi:hypothetical protein K2173_016943 [Erythroxylum novogranatense]|uniref:Uncharacterized protein n=1 Tax=Erythroxylum novogranatense TaxID=1862640 RepID=A0AAV8U5A4_9ROSI|nr:hypothetical protein K2173_016943 [Erythroxylum novogranatense]